MIDIELRWLEMVRSRTWDRMLDRGFSLFHYANRHWPSLPAVDISENFHMLNVIFDED